MQGSTLMEAGAAGRGSKVAQYRLSIAASGSKISSCRETFLKVSEAVEFPWVELVDDVEFVEDGSESDEAATRYSCVRSLSEASSVNVDAVELSVLFDG